MARPKMLLISDTHCPWHDQRRVNEVLRWARAEKPECIVHLGDLMDQYLLSGFDKDHTQLLSPGTARREWSKSRDLLRSLSKIAQTTWIPGNHDLRVRKLVIKHPYLDLYTNDPLRDLANECGVKLASKKGIRVTKGPMRLKLRHQGPKGFLTRLRDMSVVQGHHHRLFIWNQNERIYGAEAGHLARASAPCFDYFDTDTSEWCGGFIRIDHRWVPHIEALR